MPAEKTFPNGFSYLFAAILKEGEASFETKEGYGLSARMEISDVRKEKAKTDYWFKTYFYSHGPKYEPMNKVMGVAAGHKNMAALPLVTPNCYSAITLMHIWSRIGHNDIPIFTLMKLNLHHIM